MLRLGGEFFIHWLLLADIPASYIVLLDDYAALKKVGVAMFGYGHFLTAVPNFLIIAFVIFPAVRTANKLNKP